MTNEDTESGNPKMKMKVEVIKKKREGREYEGDISHLDKDIF
jgi:hypothetical protein